jgi:T4 RnlA family RNA ligase
MEPTMNVQEYLLEHSLEKLKEEFSLVVRDYPDRVVLNYNQIDSPRFNPITDECRGLILRKDTWEVLARSFDRFYNIGEGEQWKQYPIKDARFDQKLDGSLISVYHDGEKWNVATRGMAYAEGETAAGFTFNELFKMAVKDTKLWKYLEDFASSKYYTYVFELTSQFNKIVTPYSEPSVTLLAMRDNATGDEQEAVLLNREAATMGVKRPQPFQFQTIDEVVEAASALESMEEGFVLVVERKGSFWRMKCKNPKYVAIAHMRMNGQISPKNVLTLLIDNDHHEYLEYFPEDEKYFDFVEKIFNDIRRRIMQIYMDCCSIEDQKEFAIAIQQRTEMSFENGVLFKMRKAENGVDSLGAILNQMGGKKMAKSINLKSQFIKEFGFKEEDLEDND